ncbi:hypothetical protein CORT_0G03200 [Candida orthopsilosis Co 90-125]|uniref:Uncharacterized protein n=1 Tax=Candida orthopsilosis (strain 90-125) TaxID=1136231 RepID=H8XA20_CANO9|nr:hypothetical protein CORT_0G03200 [Candida orthopsilosis Co 90-125]CCG24997.1 hypothetical protein CORT_0G03200 [Candida orthopsilosis Co 90-125]
MENYNQFLLQQLNPFLRIHIDPTIINTNEVKTLLTQFELYNVKNKVWDNGAIRNRLTTPKYIINVDHEDNIDVPKRDKLPNQHSAISPFNKESLIFPNGILTHQWFEKYITKLPFGLIYVCELGSAANDVELVINMKKLKLKLEEIDCKLILLLITPQSIDEERMNMFRAELNFPKPQFLFNLSKSSLSVQSDCEVLVSKILSSLTKTSHDYYANLEYKLKQRYKKIYDIPPTDDIDTSIELTPKFLEIRNMIKQAMILQFMNPSNLEPGIKLLEIAYQDLISLLDGIYAVNLSDHDNTIIGQLMTLVDIIAFHIVRGYFTIEEPIKSLRKHKTHIINVVEVLQRDHDWISVQYEWLAQLMKLIPYSIITNLNTTAVLQMKAKSKSANTSAMMSHFGGIHTPEFDLITNPGLVLVKAYEMNSDTKKRIELLQSAIETLETNQSNALHKSSVSGQDNLDSLLSYLTWLIGEEYFSNGDFKQASDYFEMAYSSLGSAKWTNISYFLLEKLLQCYTRLRVKKSELNTILKLSTIPKQYIQNKLAHSSTNMFEFDNGSDAMELDILDSKLHEIFLVDVLLINDKLCHDTTVNDDVLIQIDLKSKLNLKMMKLLLSESTEIKVSLNQIDVSFTRIDDKLNTTSPGLKHISITNDATKHRTNANSIISNGQELNTTFVDSANLAIDSSNSLLTIQQVQKVTSAGHFQIDVIKLQITIELKHKNKVIRLNKIELHQSFPHALIQRRKVKLANGTSKPIRLGNDGTSSTATVSTAHQLIVTPPKPDFSIALSKEIDCYIVGERLSIPMKCEFKNKGIFHRAHLMANVKHGDVVVTWDKLKDEEPIELKVGANAEEVEEKHEHVLHVYARNWSGDVMNIEVSLAVVYNEVEGEGDESSDDKGKENRDVGVDGGDASVVYKVFELQLPVVPEPFQYHYSISPYLDEKCLTQNEEGSTTKEVEEEDTALKNKPDFPLSLRQWRGKLRLVDQYASKFGSTTSDSREKLLNSLQIIDVNFDIISGLPDLLLNLVSKEGEYDQLFTTQLPPSGKIYRNAQIITSMVVKWKRPDEKKDSGGDGDGDHDDHEVINEFSISEWKVQVPLVDPRVLLYIKEKSTSGKDDGDYFTFYYVIENPSIHSLTFVSELTNFDKLWQLDTSADGNGEDEDNDMQKYLSSKPFTVDPNYRKIIQFQLKKVEQHLGSDSASVAVKLPTFKLFDINYKVYLYVVPTQSNVKLKDGNLYLL